MVRYQRAELPLKLDGLAAARSFFADCLAEQDPTKETLWVAHLDDQARCIHLTSHEGDAEGVDLPLREIVIDAVVHRPSAIVLAHNHPSGDARPSSRDFDATRRLAVLVAALDCRIADHLVFGGDDCTSLRDLGYL